MPPRRGPAPVPPPEEEPAVAGLADPKSYGTGRWPNKDYRGVEPAWLGDLLEDWQDSVRDARERRHSLGWNQRQLAEEAHVALNTVAAFERGEWVHLPNALKLFAVLGLRQVQPVDVRMRRRRAPRGPA